MNYASGKLYFSQRASIFFNSDPPLKNILFVAPFIAVLQFGILASWIFLVAYLKVWSLVCTAIILLIYFITIESIVFQWKPIRDDFENAILADDEIKNVSKRIVDVGDIFWTAIFTALVCPCTVWYEPTKPLLKIQGKHTLTKLFLPLSNLLIITMLAISVSCLHTVTDFKMANNPPLTFCFANEYGNQSNQSMYFKLVNSTLTSESRWPLDFCLGSDCEPTVRICAEGESETLLFDVVVLPILIFSLLLSLMSSLCLFYISNFDNLYDWSKALKFPIVNPILLQQYLMKYDFHDEIREQR